MKYIIKNCDCYGFGDACLSNNSERLYCKDITDCLLKRILAIVDTYRSCYRDPISEIVDGEEVDE